LKWIWQTLSASSALASVALPIIDAPRKIETMIEVQAEWLHLMHGYEDLWRIRRTLEDEVFSNRLSEFKKREVEVSTRTAKLPSDDKKLAERCYAEVLQSRGLA
jgi:hypothetical protein